MNVIISPEAKDDLIEIYTYVSKHDGFFRADSILDQLQQKCSSLNTHPERGHLVPELKRINVLGFREIHLKPFRIIFQINNNSVFIHAILDGRRELQDILEKRMLR